MANDFSLGRKKLFQKLWCVSLLPFAIISLLACVAAIPVIIYQQATKMQTATVHVNASADNVYQTTLRLLEQRPDIQIVKQEDEKRKVEIKRAEKYASIKVAPLDGSKTTQLVVTADADVEEKDKEEDKELALKIVTAICDELGVSYTVARE